MGDTAGATVTVTLVQRQSKHIAKFPPMLRFRRYGGDRLLGYGGMVFLCRASKSFEVMTVKAGSEAECQQVAAGMVITKIGAKGEASMMDSFSLAALKKAAEGPDEFYILLEEPTVS